MLSRKTGKGNLAASEALHEHLNEHTTAYPYIPPRVHEVNYQCPISGDRFLEPDETNFAPRGFSNVSLWDPKRLLPEVVDEYIEFARDALHSHEQREQVVVELVNEASLYNMLAFCDYDVVRAKFMIVSTIAQWDEAKQYNTTKEEQKKVIDAFVSASRAATEMRLEQQNERIKRVLDYDVAAQDIKWRSFNINVEKLIEARDALLPNPYDNVDEHRVPEETSEVLKLQRVSLEDAEFVIAHRDRMKRWIKRANQLLNSKSGVQIQMFRRLLHDLNQCDSLLDLSHRARIEKLIAKADAWVQQTRVWFRAVKDGDYPDSTLEANGDEKNGTMMDVDDGDDEVQHDGKQITVARIENLVKQGLNECQNCMVPELSFFQQILEYVEGFKMMIVDLESYRSRPNNIKMDLLIGRMFERRQAIDMRWLALPGVAGLRSELAAVDEWLEDVKGVLEAGRDKSYSQLARECKHILARTKKFLFNTPHFEFLKISVDLQQWASEVAKVRRRAVGRGQRGPTIQQLEELLAEAQNVSIPPDAKEYKTVREHLEGARKLYETAAKVLEPKAKKQLLPFWQDLLEQMHALPVDIGLEADVEEIVKNTTEWYEKAQELVDLISVQYKDDSEREPTRVPFERFLSLKRHEQLKMAKLDHSDPKYKKVNEVHNACQKWCEEARETLQAFKGGKPVWMEKNIKKRELHRKTVLHSLFKLQTLICEYENDPFYFDEELEFSDEGFERQRHAAEAVERVRKEYINRDPVKASIMNIVAPDCSQYIKDPMILLETVPAIQDKGEVEVEKQVSAINTRLARVAELNYNRAVKAKGTQATSVVAAGSDSPTPEKKEDKAAAAKRCASAEPPPPATFNKKRARLLWRIRLKESLKLKALLQEMHNCAEKAHAMIEFDESKTDRVYPMYTMDELEETVYSLGRYGYFCDTLPLRPLINRFVKATAWLECLRQLLPPLVPKSYMKKLEKERREMEGLAEAAKQPVLKGRKASKSKSKTSSSPSKSSSSSAASAFSSAPATDKLPSLSQIRLLVSRLTNFSFRHPLLDKERKTLEYCGLERVVLPADKLKVLISQCEDWEARAKEALKNKSDVDPLISLLQESWKLGVRMDGTTDAVEQLAWSQLWVNTATQLLASTEGPEGQRIDIDVLVRLFNQLRTKYPKQVDELVNPQGAVERKHSDAMDVEEEESAVLEDSETARDEKQAIAAEDASEEKSPMDDVVAGVINDKFMQTHRELILKVLTLFTGALTWANTVRSMMEGAIGIRHTEDVLGLRAPFFYSTRAIDKFSGVQGCGNIPPERMDDKFIHLEDNTLPCMDAHPRSVYLKQINDVLLAWYKDVPSAKEASEKVSKDDKENVRLGVYHKVHKIVLDRVQEEPYCYCGLSFPDGALMLCCEECSQWYHAICLNLTKDDVKGINKFYCQGCCFKSKRVYCGKSNPSLTSRVTGCPEHILREILAQHPRGVVSREFERLTALLAKTDDVKTMCVRVLRESFEDDAEEEEVEEEVEEAGMHIDEPPVEDIALTGEPAATAAASAGGSMDVDVPAPTPTPSVVPDSAEASSAAQMALDEINAPTPSLDAGSSQTVQGVTAATMDVSADTPVPRDDDNDNADGVMDVQDTKTKKAKPKQTDRKLELLTSEEFLEYALAKCAATANVDVSHEVRQECKQRIQGYQRLVKRVQRKVACLDVALRVCLGLGVEIPERLLLVRRAAALYATQATEAVLLGQEVLSVLGVSAKHPTFTGNDADFPRLERSLLSKPVCIEELFGVWVPRVEQEADGEVVQDAEEESKQGAKNKEAQKEIDNESLSRALNPIVSRICSLAVMELGACVEYSGVPADAQTAAHRSNEEVAAKLTALWETAKNWDRRITSELTRPCAIDVIRSLARNVTSELPFVKTAALELLLGRIDLVASWVSKEKRAINSKYRLSALVNFMIDRIHNCGRVTTKHTRVILKTIALAQQWHREFDSSVRRFADPSVFLALTERLETQEILVDLKDAGVCKVLGEQYCLCFSAFEEGLFMVCCDDCQGWFHAHCVNSTQEVLEAQEHYMCPACCANKGVEYPHGFVRGFDDTIPEERQTVYIKKLKAIVAGVVIFSREDKRFAQWEALKTAEFQGNTIAKPSRARQIQPKDDKSTSKSKKGRPADSKKGKGTLVFQDDGGSVSDAINQSETSKTEKKKRKPRPRKPRPAKPAAKGAAAEKKAKKEKTVEAKKKRAGKFAKRAVVTRDMLNAANAAFAEANIHMQRVRGLELEEIERFLEEYRQECVREEQEAVLESEWEQKEAARFAKFPEGEPLPRPETKQYRLEVKAQLRAARKLEVERILQAEREATEAAHRAAAAAAASAALEAARVAAEAKEKEEKEAQERAAATGKKGGRKKGAGKSAKKKGEDASKLASEATEESKANVPSSSSSGPSEEHVAQVAVDHVDDVMMPMDGKGLDHEEEDESSDEEEYAPALLAFYRQVEWPLDFFMQEYRQPSQCMKNMLLTLDLAHRPVGDPAKQTVQTVIEESQSLGQLVLDLEDPVPPTVAEACAHFSCYPSPRPKSLFFCALMYYRVYNRLHDENRNIVWVLLNAFMNRSASEKQLEAIVDAMRSVIGVRISNPILVSLERIIEDTWVEDRSLFDLMTASVHKRGVTRKRKAPVKSVDLGEPIHMEREEDSKQEDSLSKRQKLNDYMDDSTRSGGEVSDSARQDQAYGVDVGEGNNAAIAAPSPEQPDTKSDVPEDVSATGKKDADTPEGPRTYPSLPQSAYRYFYNARKTAILQSQPGATMRYLNKNIISAWKTLSDADRREFDEMASQDTERFRLEVNEWRSEHPNDGDSPLDVPFDDGPIMLTTDRKKSEKKTERGTKRKHADVAAAANAKDGAPPPGKRAKGGKRAKSSSSSSSSQGAKSK